MSMPVVISPFSLQGSLVVPSSKSVLQRALLLASLAEGESWLHRCTHCDDVDAVRNMIGAMGAEVSGESSWRVTPAKRPFKKSLHLNAGESGLALRMFSPVASTFGVSVRIDGKGSLRNRPLEPLIASLQSAGIETSFGGSLPIEIKSGFRQQSIEVDGSFSSQILTGLLMASALGLHDTEIRVKQLKSKPYIELTLRIMSLFGLVCENDHFQRFYVPGNQLARAADMVVEGDWSAASMWLAGAAVSGDISITGLNIASSQADVAMMQALELFGAKTSIRGHEIRVSKGEHRCFAFDAGDCPDLFPALMLLAAAAQGESVLHGTDRLIHKESNRLETLMELFGSMGLDMVHEKNRLIVRGIGRLKATDTRAFNDHRLVMCAAMCGVLADEPFQVHGTDSVKKSYPAFFDDLKLLSKNK